MMMDVKDLDEILRLIDPDELSKISNNIKSVDTYTQLRPNHIGKMKGDPKKLEKMKTSELFEKYVKILNNKKGRDYYLNSILIKATYL